ncbi:MAG TPA: glycosyltransferase family 1 protein [Gemmatimonadaceae bacterium]|nr:glycosyltransferase family 1 protein [Gemmatimonadaceae bacterium]
MRIILDYRPALRERTGVGEYVHEIAAALARLAPAAGDEVTLFSSSRKDRLPAAAVDGARVVDRRIPVRLLNLAWHRLEWPTVERLAHGRFDIAHSGHPLLMPSHTAAQVITIHDLDFLEHPERTSREIRRDYPALVRDHACRADLVVVSSQQTYAHVASALGVEAERLALCPAGAPPWPTRDPAERGTYLLFVGTLEPRKNIGVLLDAYSLLLERRADAPSLHLAGRSTPEAVAWLDRLTRPPLSGRVQYLGYVPAEDRRALYAGAIALVVPSLTEGFGLTALEAMATGVPVVASNRGSLPELVADAGMLIDPTDVEALARALERVAFDTSDARTRAERGRERAAHFSWNRSAAELRRGYQRAIARGEARRRR